MNYDIIKEYDIRGKWLTEWNLEDIKLIANSLSKELKPRNVIIAKDTRNGSSEIANLLINILKNNSRIFYLGISTTPMFYFANVQLKADLGIMITASHNPSEYNGMKILKDGKNIAKTELLEIIKKHETINDNINNNLEMLEKFDILNDYTKFLKIFFKKMKQTIIVDAMHGTAFLDGKILSSFVNVIPLHFVPMHDFPITPDPSNDENLKELKELCINLKKIGIAFDGDSDRVRFVTETGRIVQNDIIIALLMKYYKFREAVVTLNVSDIVREVAKTENIKLIETKVGRNHIKEVMESKSISFGAEVSGHFFFRDFYYFDSGIFTALKVLSILDYENKTLEELVQPFLKYFKEEFTIEIKNKDNFLIELKKQYSKNAIEIKEIDGIFIRTKNFWINARKSNTEDKIRIYLESNDKNINENIKNEITKLAQKYKQQY
ncbi:MAG: hypothetical protein QXS41_03315 [Candidatus Woesearchaeota archaeon]